MQLAIFGTGYVGLVAAACFADKGNHVVCVDIDPAKVQRLQGGDVPFYEPGLAELITRNRERLTFTTDAKVGVKDAECIFIAVGTPQKRGSLDADLRYVETVAKTIAQHMSGAKTVIIKSTVPVGTAKQVEKLMRQHTKHAVRIVSNPEFLKEGDAVRDFESPDRVVIGATDETAIQQLTDLYAPFFRKRERFFVMNNESAELAKYGSNVMLASRISVMNELSRLAETSGADILSVREVIGSDSRIGSAFLFPGPGYGGSCFPKDVREIVALADRIGTAVPLIAAIDKTNEDQKEYFADRVKEALAPIRGKRIAVWGVAFKAKTDDVRKSASLTLIDSLLAAGAIVAVYDPEALANAKKIYGDTIAYADQYGCLDGADALIIMTEWNVFRTPDFAEMKRRLKAPVIIDGRNLYSLEQMADEGFTYRGIGRGVR